MTNDEKINKLKELANAPETTKGFPSQRDCIEWVNQVGKLVNHNHYFYQCFSEQSDLINTVGLSGDLYGTAINKLLTLINQVITDLEAGYLKVSEESSDTRKTKLEPPDKVTLKWLWEHVPSSYYWTALVFLFAIFCLGIAFGKTSLYKSLIEETTATINKSPNAPPTSK